MREDPTDRLIAIHDALGRIEAKLDRVVADASSQDHRLTTLETWRNWSAGAIAVIGVWLERTNLGHLLAVFH